MSDEARQAGSELLSELQAAQAKSAAVIDAALDAVIIADGDGRISGFNPAAERMFGYTASHAIGRSREALRVLVTASPDTRATRVCELKGLDETRARRVVKDEDSSRRDYLKRFYAVDQELPTHYDLVVNTDVLSVEQAAQLVAQAASS